MARARPCARLGLQRLLREAARRPSVADAREHVNVRSMRAASHSPHSFYLSLYCKSRFACVLCTFIAFSCVCLSHRQVAFKVFKLSKCGITEVHAWWAKVNTYSHQLCTRNFSLDFILLKQYDSNLFGLRYIPNMPMDRYLSFYYFHTLPLPSELEYYINTE